MVFLEFDGKWCRHPEAVSKVNERNGSTYQLAVVDVGHCYSGSYIFRSSLLDMHEHKISKGLNTRHS